MECTKIKEILSLYLDKSLTEPENIQVEEHLKTCPRCPEELEKLKKTVQLVKAVEEIDPPDNFLTEVCDKLNREPKWKKLVRRLIFPLPVKLPLEALAMVLIAVVIVSVHRSYLFRSDRPAKDEYPPPLDLEREEELVLGELRSNDGVKKDEVLRMKSRGPSLDKTEVSTEAFFSDSDKFEEGKKSPLLRNILEPKELSLADNQINIVTDNIPMSLLKAQKVICLNEGNIIKPSDKNIASQIAAPKIQRSQVLFKIPSRNYSQVVTQLKEAGEITSAISLKENTIALKREIREEKDTVFINILLDLTQSEKK